MEYIFSVREYLAISDEVHIILSVKNAHRLFAKAEIFSLLEPKRILLSEPVYNDVIFEPTIEKTYEMRVYKNGLGEYSFKGTFIAERIVNDKRFFIVEVNNKFLLRQRREFFRFTVFTDIDVKVFEKNGDKLLERGIARLMNISGGGMAIVSNLDLEIEKVYVFGFEFEKQHFLLSAQVLRHNLAEGYKQKKISGLMFVDIENAERRRVMGAINAAQIRQLKRD